MSFWDPIRAKFSLLVQTRLARFTLYIAGVEAILIVLRWIMSLAGASSIAGSLAGWVRLLGLVICVLLIALAVRWFRDHVMWSVRNRLIVTYLFIGGVPVTLGVVLALGTGYLAAEHLATFLAISQIQAQEQRLGAANAAAAEQIVRQHATPERIMASDTVFPGRTVTLLTAASAPRWLKDGFAGLVSDHGQLSLRAANSISTSAGPQTVVSTATFDQKFLARIAENLGSLALTRVQTNNGRALNIRSDTNLDISPQATAILSAGSLPPPKAAFDQEFQFGGLIEAIDWTTGETESSFLVGSTRPSAIVSYLGASMGVWTGVIGLALVGVAVTFAVMILVALLIGIRLTRTVTYSVANLYKATEHINRGDFSHRIQVRHKDQLGALQTAFNSMTESLEKLIVEQKEKERLQSELEIAHEVQSQLFPQAASGTRSLEVCGVCMPARIVSGDYYDFISYSPAQIGIAVGDISGKGISAALLMATIHSAIRAYQQEQALETGVASAYGTGPTRVSTSSSRIVQPSPAETLWLLNRHLYQSTTPEKYATLFLGLYDDETRRLTYSNAGHLPPIVLGRDGSIRRLDVGGTVVGLFDFVEYEKQAVELYPGDLFIAFSDGMTEPENDYGEFGEERLVETIAAYRDLPLERICDHATAAVQDWIGSNEQPDDLTLVLARRSA